MAGRKSRVYTKAVENFPLVCGTMLFALATGVHAEVTDGLALTWVAARLGQMAVHSVSTSSAAVLIRGHFFLRPS